MEKNKFQLVLGSQSPRRRELLKSLFIDFEIIVSNIEEKSNLDSVTDMVMDLSAQKAAAVLEIAKERYKRPIVIGSDTIVVTEGNEVLGKPKTIDNARQMLQKLSGNSHYVYTGVSIQSMNGILNFFERTKVTFEVIDSELLEKYLQTGESLDKAGAYGVQSGAQAFIKSLEGSYSSVVGLPVNRVLEKLEKFIIEKENGEKKWRYYFV